MTRHRKGALVDVLLVAAVVLLVVTVSVMFRALLGALDGALDLPWLGILLLLVPTALLLGFLATVLGRRRRERIARLTHLRRLGRPKGEEEEATQP